MTMSAAEADVVGLFHRPHALYRMYGLKGDLLYVGITFSMLQRLWEHRGSQPWWPEVATIKIEHFDDRAAALEAEAEAIQIERPRYNVMLQARTEASTLLPGVDSEAVRRLKLAVAARRRAETAETAAVIAAIQDGVTQVDVARILGRSREHVRLLLKRAADG